jgi:predicted phosphoribosyltransferase
MIYENRSEAGKRLARELAGYEEQNPLVLALPRGGLVVAAEIAWALDAALDIVLVRKLGVPDQPELAMGAVVNGGSPYVVRNEDIIEAAGISEDEFEQVCRRELAEIGRRRQLYLKDRPRAELQGRVVIVVDDGIATGATTLAALRSIRKRQPKKLVLAVPVAPTSTLDELAGVADEIVCLQSHEPFYAIGAYYADFHQVRDREVIEILKKTRAPDGVEAASQDT